MPDCEEVRFLRPDETPYGPLSNYYLRPIRLDGTTYRSVEHAFQAKKAARIEVAAWIAAAPDGLLAAAAGDALPEHEIVPQWAESRAEIMRPLLAAKFGQHADLRALLLATGQAEIAEWAEEDTPTNRFWSKVDGAGDNVLGKLLMALRAELAARPRERRTAAP